MTQSDLAVVVLAAGMGTRMRSDLPKVLHAIAGKPMLRHVLDAVEPLAPERIVVVTGPGMPQVEEVASPHKTVVQAERLGTGHAVMAARDALSGLLPNGDVMVVFGDSPSSPPRPWLACAPCAAKVPRSLRWASSPPIPRPMAGFC
jgi:bifunctional UDP-N-acetylglucosamine pyrophosphorylase/glucosamine-1-phosphate N-acetyltransferase